MTNGSKKRRKANANAAAGSQVTNLTPSHAFTTTVSSTDHASSSQLEPMVPNVKSVEPAKAADTPKRAYTPKTTNPGKDGNVSKNSKPTQTPNTPKTSNAPRAANASKNTNYPPPTRPPPTRPLPTPPVKQSQPQPAVKAGGQSSKPKPGARPFPKSVKPVVPALPKTFAQFKQGVQAIQGGRGGGTKAGKAAQGLDSSTATASTSASGSKQPEATRLTVSAPMPILDPLSIPSLTPVISMPTMSIATARQFIEGSHGLVSTPASCAAYIDLTKPVEIPKFGTVEYYEFMEAQGRDLGKGGKVGKKAAIIAEKKIADAEKKEEKKLALAEKKEDKEREKEGLKHTWCKTNYGMPRGCGGKYCGVASTEGSKEKDETLVNPKLEASNATDPSAETAPPAAPQPRKDKSGKGARARRDEKRAKIHMEKFAAATALGAANVAQMVAENATRMVATDPFYEPLQPTVVMRSQDVRNEVGYAEAAATASGERLRAIPHQPWLDAKGKGKQLVAPPEYLSQVSRGLGASVETTILPTSEVAPDVAPKLARLVYRGPQADFKSRAPSGEGDVQELVNWGSGSEVLGIADCGGGIEVLGFAELGGGDEAAKFAPNQQLFLIDRKSGTFSPVNNNVQHTGYFGNFHPLANLDKTTPRFAGAGIIDQSISEVTTLRGEATTLRGEVTTHRGQLTTRRREATQFSNTHNLEDPFIDLTLVEIENAQAYFIDLSKYLRMDIKGLWHFKHRPGSRDAFSADSDSDDDDTGSTAILASASMMAPDITPPAHRPEMLFPTKAAGKGKAAAGNSKQYNSAAATNIQQFSRLQAFSKHNQVDNSPLFPKNLSELAAHQKDYAVDKNKEEMERLKLKIQDKEAEVSGSQVKIMPAFGGKKFNDGRSRVLGLESAFAPPVDTSNMSRLEAELHEKPKVDWPGLNERKAYGEGRHERGLDRQLPPPRMVDVVPEHIVWLINQGVNSHEAMELYANPGGLGKDALFWKFRKICEENGLDEINYEVKDWARAENAKDVAQRKHALAKLEGKTSCMQAIGTPVDTRLFGRQATMEGAGMRGISEEFIKLKEGHYQMQDGREIDTEPACELDEKEARENGWLFLDAFK